MSIEEIKAAYPNEWVLLGNPEYSGLQVISGEVIYHAKDKREVAEKSRGWQAHYNRGTTVYTGERTAKLFWL